jgi:hypothetical protein
MDTEILLPRSQNSLSSLQFYYPVTKFRIQSAILLPR